MSVRELSISCHLLLPDVAYGLYFSVAWHFGSLMDLFDKDPMPGWVQGVYITSPVKDRLSPCQHRSFRTEFGALHVSSVRQYPVGGT